MPRRIYNIDDIEDDLDVVSELDLTEKEQTDKLIDSMYYNPKLSVFDVPDTISYVEQAKCDDVTDSITDELLCRAYTAAKQAINVSDRIMSNSLGLTKSKYRKLLESEPKFAMAVQCGIMDGQQEMYDDLTKSMYNLATGRIVCEEVKTETQDVVNTLGKVIGTSTKTTVVRKKLPPDSKVAFRLLSRLDPSWKQDSKEVDVNIQLAQELKVTEDVNMSIDPTKLPPEILDYLITSQTKGLNGNDKVGGNVEVVLDNMEIQSKIHTTLKDLNNEVLSKLPIQEDVVVDKETMDAITKPKKKRGRPKKSSN